MSGKTSGRAGLPPEPAKLNQIGVLTRREIEARLLAPLLAELVEAFGQEQVYEIVRQVIIRIARWQGAQLAEQVGDPSLAHFAASMEAWKLDDAMQIEVLEQSEGQFSFDVHRCRYAEMYRELGIPELGTLLSCNRDFSLIKGFNPGVRLTRHPNHHGRRGFLRLPLRSAGGACENAVCSAACQIELEGRRYPRPRPPAQQARQG